MTKLHEARGGPAAFNGDTTLICIAKLRECIREANDHFAENSPGEAELRECKKTRAAVFTQGSRRDQHPLWAITLGIRLLQSALNIPDVIGIAFD